MSAIKLLPGTTITDDFGKCKPILIFFHFNILGQTTIEDGMHDVSVWAMIAEILNDCKWIFVHT